MKRKSVQVNISEYPEALSELLKSAPIYDSSCSKEAQVLFIDKDGGYYVKKAMSGTLKTEELMTGYMHSLGLSAEVLYYGSFDEARHIAEEGLPLLKTDVLLHGDYCLPNILLDDWKFSGYIDLGNGGMGDRHIDIIWGIWTLMFNLRTDKYTGRFMDAYGMEMIEPEMLRMVAAMEMIGV